MKTNLKEVKLARFYGKGKGEGKQVRERREEKKNFLWQEVL